MNLVYPKFKEALLQGNGNLLSGDVKVVLVDLADYTYSASHEFLSDVPTIARVATSGNLTAKTVTNGVFDSADPSFSNVTGDVSESLILFIDTGSPATSRLVAFYDAGVANLPVTPNGGNINLTVNASGWFAL